MNKGSRIGKCYTCEFNATCPYSDGQYIHSPDMKCMQYIPNDYGLYANVGIVSTTDTYKLYYRFIRGAIYD